MRGQRKLPGLSLPPGKTRYSLYRRLDGPQGRSGQVRNITPPIKIRSPDRPARSQSLYRLRYPAHVVRYNCLIFILRRCLFIRLYVFFGWMKEIRARSFTGMILTEGNRLTWGEMYSSATLSTTNPTRWRILSCGT